jgi:serine/threonine protein kinase
MSSILLFSFTHSDLLVFSDIKSANILFNDQAEIKLADFGIARQLSEELPSLKGTAGYFHDHLSFTFHQNEIHSLRNNHIRNPMFFR